MLFLLVSLLVVNSVGLRAEETSDTPKVDAILTRYVQALGGEEAIRALTSRMAAGQQITDFSSREHPTYESLYFEARSQASGSYHCQVWSDQGDYQEGFDGTNGWAIDRCGVRDDDRTGRDKLAFLINPQGALQIESYFPGLTFAGVEEIDGIAVAVLIPDTLPEAHYSLYFSRMSGLLVRIGYYWTLEDYREVDNVMVPSRIVASRKGGSTTYELASISHNIEFDDSTFRAPGDK
jgi:hypothetical protein